MDAGIKPSASDLVIYKVITEGLRPQRADRSGLGTLPARALKYCEPISLASEFGWYVFLPIDLYFIWDGYDILWSFDGGEEYEVLTSAQFPDFAKKFDSLAPKYAVGYSPPFVSAMHDPGMVQIWTGCLAKTAPDWWLLVRPPANLRGSAGYQLFEGVVESDRWFGPLFTNIRLTKTGVPVLVPAEYPFVQLQALPKSLFSAANFDCAAVHLGLEGLGVDEWQLYCQSVVAPNKREHGILGERTRVFRKRVRSEDC